MKAKKVKELATQVAQAEPELAKQLRERNRKAADGGIHAVKHRVKNRSRKQEAAAAKQLKNKPPRRRWQRPSFLPGMPKIAGYHLEYVRRDNRNRGDYANLSAHLRSGWELCKPSDFDDEALPTIRMDRYGEVIGNDDTILMKIDEESWAERNDEYESQRDATTQAINSPVPALDVSHPAMPIKDYENRVKVTHRPMAGRRGRNREVSVAED